MAQSVELKRPSGIQYLVPDDASDLDGASFLVFKDANGNETDERTLYYFSLTVLAGGQIIAVRDPQGTVTSSWPSAARTRRSSRSAVSREEPSVSASSP